MKTLSIFSTLFFVVLFHANGAGKTIEKSFCQNMGQICDKNFNAHPEILFSATLPNLNIYIKKNSIIYQFLNTYSENGISTLNHNLKEKENKIIPGVL